MRLDTTTDPRTVAGEAGRVAAFDGPTSTVHAGLAARLGGTAFARDVVLHELVHAAQARTDDLTTGGVGASRISRLRLGLCDDKPTAPTAAADPLDTLRSGRKLSAAEAKSLLDHYETLGAAERDKAVTEFHKVGDANSGVRRLLEGLDPAEMKARRALVTDIEERVQRLAVEATAGKNLGELGAAQGAWMKSEAEKRALAAAAAEAAKKKQPAPKAVTPAEMATEHEKETKRTSPVKEAAPVNPWDALGAPAQATWNTRATTAIAKVVDACKRKAPELGITAANIRWDPKAVAARGANVYAFSGDPITVGMLFVETAEADPEYCVRIVVHEIAGHPEFGTGTKSYEAEIYAEAHRKEPTLGSPWDTAAERKTYGYIATEMYSALRELPYEKPLSAADAKKGLVTGIDPTSNVDDKVGLIKAKYAPGVAEVVVQGLYERFRVDPRITPKALKLYETMVEKHFGKKALKK